MAMWTEESIHLLTERQREFFQSGVTLDIAWRVEQLQKLKRAVILHEEELKQALASDLGGCAEEAYLCDIGTSILEINEAIRGVR